MAIEWFGHGCDAKQGIWISDKGDKIKVGKMDSEYIRNCIAFIRTYGGCLRDFELDKLDELEQELFNRGETV